MKLKKAFIFLIGSLLPWVVVILLVGGFVLGEGPIELLRYLLPSLHSNPSLENPINDIPGEFISEIDSEASPQRLLMCANDIESAKDLFERYYGSTFLSNRYFAAEIENAPWREFPEYYSVRMARSIDGKDIWNVLRCSYFQEAKTYPSYKIIDDSQIGTTTIRTEEEFDHLSWFLQEIGVIQNHGFNQDIQLYKSTVSDSDGAITRSDEGTYKVYDDTSSRSSTSKVRTIYRLRKSDGTVYYSRQITK